MTLLTIAVLGVAVVESRDRVRHDVYVSDADIRSWYDTRYANRGLAFTRKNLELALQRAQKVRRWGPWALSAGTMLTALILAFIAVSTVPGIESALLSPGRLTDLVSTEVLAEAGAVLLMLPVLVVEGILAALYVAEFDIGRLKRLLRSLD